MSKKLEGKVAVVTGGSRPPVDLDLRYEGVKRHRPTPAGSITIQSDGITP
jgi:hypothetical protein